MDNMICVYILDNLEAEEGKPQLEVSDERAKEITTFMHQNWDDQNMIEPYYLEEDIALFQSRLTKDKI
jgi:hypothetical protein